MGWHKACEIALLARKLDAKAMQDLGLVNRVVAHDAVLDEALSWASELSNNPPLAVAAIACADVVQFAHDRLAHGTT